MGGTIEGYNLNSRLTTVEGYNIDSRVTTIEGYNLNSRLTTVELTGSVWFDAIRTWKLKFDTYGAWTTVTYDMEQGSPEGRSALGTGTFTCQTKGIYHFSS